MKLYSVILINKNNDYIKEIYLNKYNAYNSSSNEWELLDVKTYDVNLFIWIKIIILSYWIKLKNYI